MLIKAIILGAGRGRRLAPYTREMPKCLLEVGGKTILEHQISKLNKMDVRNITVVTGYKAELIHRRIGKKVKYIHNPFFSQTSSLYSLWLARHDPFCTTLILNGDVLFHRDILKRLVESPFPDAVTVELASGLGREEMKIRLKGQKLAGISKRLSRYDGENLGILKFSREGLRVLFQEIERIVSANRLKEMVPFALNRISKYHDLYAVTVNDLPWIEIDFPKDLERARENIFPAICRSQG